MINNVSKKPVSRLESYLKYGFVRTEHESYYCPKCANILNAGPDYQPQYCSQCGCKLDFTGIEWRKDRELGFLERGDAYEPIEDRVVRPFLESHYRM